MGTVVDDFHKIDLEERRTVWRMLTQIQPSERIAWLVWCAAYVSGPDKTHIVESSDGSVQLVYADWVTMCYSWGLDWRVSRDNLLLRVRRASTPLFWGTTIRPSTGTLGIV